jgi:hypothetical protein
MLEMAQEKRHIFLSFMRVIMPVLLLLVIPAVQSCTAHVYHRADRKTVATFLEQLNKQFPDEGEDLSSFTKNGEVITIAKLTGSEKLHSLWIADVNNDGINEYLWTYEAEGSGHYDSFSVFRKNDDGTFAEIEFPLEGMKLTSNIADPLTVYEKGKTYLVFLNIWAENSKGEPVYAGANSNVAPDAEYIVTEELKYFWDGSGLELVSRKIDRTTLEDE